MSFNNQATQQKFPYGYDTVFDGIIEIIPKLKMALKSEDRVIGRITASVGMSLFSYGENLAIVVEKIDENTTLVGIESALKFGLNVAGAHRHQKNFDEIIEALSSTLQGNIIPDPYLC